MTLVEMESVAANPKPMASRQWSCSDLSAGLVHLLDDAANAPLPTDLLDLQASARVLHKCLAPQLSFPMLGSAQGLGEIPGQPRDGTRAED